MWWTYIIINTYDKQLFWSAIKKGFPTTSSMGQPHVESFGILQVAETLSKTSPSLHTKCSGCSLKHLINWLQDPSADRSTNLNLDSLGHEKQVTEVDGLHSR